MELFTFDTKPAMGAAAARAGADLIRAAIAQRGEANIIVATGASQFEMLSALVAEEGIAWDRVTVFHLDEYTGLSISHHFAATCGSGFTRNCRCRWRHFTI